MERFCDVLLRLPRHWSRAKPLQTVQLLLKHSPGSFTKSRRHYTIFSGGKYEHSNSNGFSSVRVRHLCDESKKSELPVSSGGDSTDTSQNEENITDLLESAVSESLTAEVNFPSDQKEGERFKNRDKRDQTGYSYRPKIDPNETTILLFPGQGSQFVGMGKKLQQFEGVKDMYDIASNILGYDLLDICLNGPKAKLDRTVYCQPAILVTSLAAIEKLKEEKPWAIERCIGTAGFSVGEYAALAFAGSMSFEDAVQIVKVRAEAMQEASEMTPSGMMTVFLRADHQLKLGCLTAERYCTQKLGIEKALCKIANYLYPECKVVAGNREALDFLEQNKHEFGIGKTVHLPVSGAFHTNLMKSAEQPVREIIQETRLHFPIVSVHSNVTSHQYKHPQSIAKLLVEQICSPVKWEQTQQVLFSRKQGENFPQIFEVGPHKQLGQLLRKMNSKAFQHYERVTV